MPIINREPDIFPEDLLDETESAVENEPPWWVLYTMSRREKRLMRQLHEWKISFYSPLIERRTRSPSGRMRISHVPLFAGYVFLRGDEEARHRALTINCISRTLPVADPAELVHDLQQIQQMIACNAPLSPEARLQPGMKVRVRGGSMSDLEGVVITRHGQRRLLVAVNFLQQGVSMLLEDFQVERID